MAKQENSDRGSETNHFWTAPSGKRIRVTSEQVKQIQAAFKRGLHPEKVATEVLQLA